MAEPKQALGRPRDSRVDHAIIEATRDLLEGSGYAALTVDAVARRAGIGKAAIYRRYATKQEMVFAAAIHDLDLPPVPDTGTLRGDLGALAADIVASLTGPAVFASVPGLFADVATDAALAARFEETFVAAERAAVATVLGRAGDRGELTGSPPVEVVHSLLLGPVFVWLFLFRGDPARIAATVADLAAAALGRPPDGP